jgi:hypothetical protein
MKALPVEPLNSSEEMEGEEVFEGSNEEAAPAEKPRAIRAIPVGDDEVIEENVEEP